MLTSTFQPFNINPEQQRHHALHRAPGEVPYFHNSRHLGRNFLLFGYDQGLSGGILAGERFQDMLGQPNPTMSGLVTAIYDIGCALGAVGAFIYGEKIGRKRSIIWANVIVIVGATIQAASYSYWQMFAARIVAGVGLV